MTWGSYNSKDAKYSLQTKSQYMNEIYYSTFKKYIFGSVRLCVNLLFIFWWYSQWGCSYNVQLCTFVIHVQLTLVISNSMGPWKKFESTIVRPTQEELRKYWKCSLFNDERETTRVKFWRAKTSNACAYSRNDFKHIRCFCCCFFLSVKFFESCGTTDNF